MFENIAKFFKRLVKAESQEINSKDAAKERLHLVLMQDRANVSADFLEMMKQEIIEVIKKYIDVDENAIDVRLTNKTNDDGTNGAPALYANIPIISIKDDKKEKSNEEVEAKSEKAENNQNSNSKKEDKKVETEVKKEEKNNKEEVKEEINSNVNETKVEEVKEDNNNNEISEENKKAEETAE